MAFADGGTTTWLTLLIHGVPPRSPSLNPSAGSPPPSSWLDAANAAPRMAGPVVPAAPSGVQRPSTCTLAKSTHWWRPSMPPPGSGTAEPDFTPSR